MYHEGELEAQQRAGVRDLAERVGRIIRPTIPGPAADFLAAQTMVIVATVNGAGAVRASALAGPPGFARKTAASSIDIRPASGHLTTVFSDLGETGRIGLLAIEFATRRRMRVNGHGTVRDGAITVTTEEVYSNCPQYIHRRGAVQLDVAQMQPTPSLTDDQRRLIESAGTFFIATAHPEKGADASHRGGDPGFVRVDGNRISWPDYDGNNMFNTIGNLLVNPRCGLLFIDFENGRTLQIEGTAAMQWQPARRTEVTVESATLGISHPTEGEHDSGRHVPVGDRERGPA